MIQVKKPSLRVGYVVKRYPRYSETFIVNEVLAHEAAGLCIEIFSLRPPEDGHFQDIIGQVLAGVHYLPHSGIRAMDFWQAIEEAGDILPGLMTKLETARGEDHINVYQALVLAREVYQRGIQHLHAHFATSATNVARLAAHFCGIPFTFTAHAKDIYHQDVDPQDMQRKLRDAASVVTVSDFNLNHLRTVYGNDAAHVRRIYNGLDLMRFSYKRPDNRPPHIISIGRLVEKKGLHDLIDACGILSERGRNFHCRIIGTGPLEGDLKVHIGRAGLQEKIELMGARPQHEVMNWIQDAAIFAGPYIVGDDGNRDGLPTVLIEAMALGTPCISTGVTGIPEILQDGKTGILVPQHDPAALAHAMEHLLIDHELGLRIAERARHLIESQFDIYHNAAQMRELFFLSSRTEQSMEMRCA